MGHTSHLSGHGRYSDQSVIVPGIRTINFSDPAETAKHDKLIALVDNMLELQKKHHEARMDRDK